MKLRKLTALALVLVLFVCAFAACDNGADTETNPPVTETDPVGTDPVETDPAETDPVETDPVETDPVETDPVETDPVETDPVETDPVETDPVETDPVETDPVETDPVETDKTETGAGETTHTHKLVEEDQASTCTVKGYHRVRCEGCDIVISEELYPLAAHTPSGEPTCTEPATCTKCGAVAAEALGHDYQTYEVTLEATCTSTGSRIGTCAREGCGHKEPEEIPMAPHTTANLGNGDLSALTVENGKVMTTCGICKAKVPVSELRSLTLDFDKDVKVELAGKEDKSTYKYAYYESKGNAAATNPPTVRGSALYIKQNTSAVIAFDHSLLSDADVYAVSFKWRRTAVNGSSSQGLLGVCRVTSTGSVSGNTFVMSIDRTATSLFMSQTGATKAGFSAKKDVWDTITIVVDNTTGNAYIYINGTYFTTNKTETMKVSEAGQGSGKLYALHLGGTFNVSISPEFDDFKIAAFNTGCEHVAGAAATCTEPQRCTVCGTAVSPALGHDLGAVTVTPATCIATGLEVTACNREGCDGVSKELPVIDHDFDVANATAHTPATCTTKGSKTGACEMGCGQTMTLPIDEVPHTTANLGDLAELTFVDGKMQAKCLVCQGTVDVAEDARLTLDFDMDDLATEIAAKNAANSNLGLSLTNGTSYACVNSVLQCTDRNALYINYNGKMLSDSAYYMISFDWRFTAAQTDGYSPLLAARTADRTGGVVACTYDRTDKVLRSGEAGSTVLYPTDGSKLTQNTWYHFTVVVNKSTGEAYVYVNNTYVNKVSSDCFKMDDGTAYSWQFNTNSSGHKPEMDNVKVVALDTSCDHVAGAAATCTTDQTCTVCGAVLTEKLGHDWGEASITNPTCLADGSETKTCERTDCGLEESTPIPKLGHAFDENAETTVVPSTCTVAGTETGTCINGCGEEVTVYLPLVPHTVESLGALSALTFKDGKIQATCTVCSETVDVIEDDRLVLNFDKADVATEINAHANKDAYKLGYEIAVEIDGQYKHPTDVATVGERSVLRLAGGGDGNWSAFFKFSGDMLKDASYYVVSFDVRFAAQRTDLSSASNKGLFACIEIEEDGTLPYTDASKKLVANALTDYAMIVDRWSLKVYNTDRSANMPATKNEWYTVNIIVDNATGNSAVYITNAAGAVTVLANENNKMLVVPGKTYAWRFGDDYNNGHDPQIDDFRVYALETVCNHLVEKTVPTTPATCTVAGEGKVVCARCGFEKRTVSLDPTGHKYSDTPDANSIAATCTEGGTNYFTCQNGCGNIKDESVAKAGHEKGEVKKELTCAMVYSCKNCTEGTVTEAKENATHTVAAPTAFDSTTVLKNNKIQGICSVCGLYADAPISETVCIQLDFDKTSLKAELEAKNTANSDLGLSAYYVNTAASGNDCFVVKSSGDRTVLNNANSGRLFLNFNEKSLADASYYVITFDWRYTAAQTGGSVNVFSVCSTSRLSTDISDPSVTNFFKYDRDVEAFTNGGDGTAAKPRTVYYPVEGKLIEDQWYTVTAIVNNATGSANIYVNDTWSHTIKADSFKMTEDGTNAFRFGESSNGHVPEYDNLKVYKIGSSVSE